MLCTYLIKERILYIWRIHCRKWQSHRKEDLIIGKIKDLTGQKFGKLIALEPTDQKRNKSVVWKCRCECGNIVYATSRNLQIGDIKSCGCTNFVIKNLIGKQFGNLTVIKDSGKRKSGNRSFFCRRNQPADSGYQSCG